MWSSHLISSPSFIAQWTILFFNAVRLHLCWWLNQIEWRATSAFINMIMIAKICWKRVRKPFGFFFFSFESKWQWNGMTYNFKWSYWMRKTWNGNIFFNSLRPSQSSLHAIFGNGIVIMDAININRNCSLSIFCNTCHTINTHQLQMFDQLKKKKNISMENLCFLFYPLVISLCFVLGTCQKRREKGFCARFRYSTKAKYRYGSIHFSSISCMRNVWCIRHF